MAGEVRARMIASAVRLLARRGLQATSFSEVLELAKAPRGSVYHHFPEGKDQMVDAALTLAGGHALSMLDELDGHDAEEIVRFFLGMWRQVLEQSSFGAGCAVLAVTVATDSPELLDHTAQIFRDWRARLADLLTHGGLPPHSAASFAAILVASSEGAVVLGRAEQSMEPFDLVAEQLLQQVRAMSGR